MSTGTELGAALRSGSACVACSAARRVQRHAFAPGASSAAATRARAACLPVRRTRRRVALACDATQAAALGRGPAGATCRRARSNAGDAGVGFCIAELRAAVCPRLTDAPGCMTGRGRHARPATAAGIRCASRGGQRRASVTCARSSAAERRVGAPARDGHQWNGDPTYRDDSAATHVRTSRGAQAFGPAWKLDGGSPLFL
jgi:hypothetical protein